MYFQKVDDSSHPIYASLQCNLVIIVDFSLREEYAP